MFGSLSREREGRRLCPLDWRQEDSDVPGTPVLCREASCQLQLCWEVYNMDRGATGTSPLCAVTSHQPLVC